MNKAVKNIPVFFMWLAWMVLTVHLIIPHDHHLSDSFSTGENRCSASGGDTGHKSGFPIHCHAFNDLASEKVIKYVLTKNIPFNIISVRSYSDPFKIQYLCITFFDFPKAFTDNHFLESSALRAPPSIS
jgi:hypothetical protein